MTPGDRPYPATPERPEGRFDATPEHRRVYLAVPYAEKDEAKKHAARWYPQRRCWWIDMNDLATHPGIHRWMNSDAGLAAKVRATDDFLHANRESRTVRLSQKVDGRKPKGRKNRGPPVSTRRTDFSLRDCLCLTPPWEHCEHSLQPGLLHQS